MHDATHNMSLGQMDRDSLFHPATAIAAHLQKGPPVMARAEGVRITDIDGKEYIDGIAGLWCVNIGYGRSEVTEAIARQSAALPYYHTFSSMSNEPQIRLAHRLLAMAPGHMSKVFFANSGSEANDTQMKLVWYYNNLRGLPAKKKIISRNRAYHGTTLAAASLTGLAPFHAYFDLPLPQVIFTECPDPYWGPAPGMDEAAYVAHLADALERLIEREGADTIGAFIAEPVMGAGGVIVPPAGYFDAIQPILKRHDILFIVDEVICGFGRLGTWFGSQTYDLDPDFITIAKGLTSGYVPMSACLISDRVWDVLRETSEKVGVFGHGFTYSGHPVAAAAAMANLDIIEREDLVGNAARTGAYFQDRLRAAFDGHRFVGNVRGKGLIAAVELVADPASKRRFAPARKVGPEIGAESIELGLIARPLGGGDILALSPPLTITTAEVDLVVARLHEAVEIVSRRLVEEGAHL